ncbi:MAG: Do family serine endopeptidase [Pseudomonadota bacterium]|nr:Do family serine endopeptidase [Pseudomonadota bacterium]
MQTINQQKFPLLFFRLTFLSILLFFSHNSYAEKNFPDFTSVVEKNIPAVVIVNAVKQIPNNFKNSPFNSPEIPEDLRDYFGRFFDDRNGNKNIERQTPAFGSGFILTNDGYIMTNNHVVSNSNEITVTLSDQTVLEAKLIGSDPRSDLALLKVDRKNLPVVSVSKKDTLKVGEWVLAIGSPFGFDHTVTAGIVSGKQRKLPNENYVPFIQTDVAINPGNSGGPLFNLDGDVVGVNAQIYSRTGGFMGVSFAIPSETMLDVFSQLKNEGKVSRGWLGVFIQEVDKNLAESFNLDKPRGAVVAKVLKNSPASKSGIKQGDIILKFDNKKINKSGDLPPMVGMSKINSRISLEILRDGKTFSKFVRIEELPTKEKVSQMKQEKVSKIEVSGITITDIDENTKRKLNIYGGVRIESVSNEQLKDSKLEINDIVTHINNEPVYNKQDFQKKVKEIDIGKYANFLVYRNSSPIYIAIKISK